jgi:hypothetical protein
VRQRRSARAARVVTKGWEWRRIGGLDAGGGGVLLVVGCWLLVVGDWRGNLGAEANLWIES